MSEDNIKNKSEPKVKRGITSLLLGWFAAKVRKTEELRRQINEGRYNPDPNAVARSLVNEDL
ncbi:MAG TPA: flagellar biosynthesis anti-sigma factor FlgM [Oligoflexia bacterium]|nr:flagellar biosynthesis anti-sigma factor FlgM [Oligoflexia bacterium]HMP26795.1 flagellar biosynthesis anti-sigma factor FlgM [Oligoflexia bacterium]